jgi:hypothetical protein
MFVTFPLSFEMMKFQMLKENRGVKMDDNFRKWVYIWVTPPNQF